MTDGKAFYQDHHDRIAEKRFDSKYPIRRTVHREIYDSVLQWIRPGERVLDAGCGEGVLSCLMADAGAEVHAVDYSRPNIDAARRRASDLGGRAASVVFECGDAERLPFADASFDCVVSNHVLEHLPSFDAGIAELYRVTRARAIVAVPTCLGPTSWALLGGDRYWRIGKRTPFAVPMGLARVAGAWVRGEDGVDETYAGRADNTHIFRFPWVVIARLRAIGFRVDAWQAQSLHLPYVPINPRGLRARPLFRNLGLGTVFHLHKGGMPR